MTEVDNLLNRYAYACSETGRITELHFRTNYVSWDVVEVSRERESVARQLVRDAIDALLSGKKL